MVLFLDFLWSVRKESGMVPKHWPGKWKDGDPKNRKGGVGGALQEEPMRNSARDMPPAEVQPGLR